ncbi:MAG: trans-sulfuration enzyme family protein [Acidimicrobiales bacterium]
MHAGHTLRHRDPMAPPIVQSSVYVFDDLEEYDAVASGAKPGHIYRRNSNENVAMLEAAVADLEGAPTGVATGSGMAAILLGVLTLAPRPGPVVVASESYGVTLAMLRNDLEPLGYETRFVNAGHPDATAAGADGAVLILAETISNPLCKITDLAALVKTARRAGVPLLVDNTFATPILQRPLDEGATAVVHSATKFIGGHSDLVAGVLVGGEQAMQQARQRRSRMGMILGPFDAWLALRGLRTLPLRIGKQSSNAARLADKLATLEPVERVHYPGIGAMLAFDLCSHDAVQQLIDRLQLARFAASLGGVETTLAVPALTSHRSLSPDELLHLGIGSRTIRVSVGIEDPDDIVADFEHALHRPERYS